MPGAGVQQRAATASAAEFVSLDDLLRESDVVTLHCRSTRDTHHFIGREQIDAMKQGAFLVNTGRGALVDTDALIVALESGKLGGAALDVLEGEEGLFYFDCTNATGRPSVPAAAATAAQRDRHPAHGLLHRGGRCTTPSKRPSSSV